MRACRFALTLPLLFGLANLALAQDYPSRVVRIIVPQAPGAGADIVTRLIAQRLTEGWGQQVIVENRPGANGIIGLGAGARAKPDGYTLVVGVSSGIAMNPFVYRNLPYDPQRDFAPITQTASNVMALVVNPSLPVRSVKSLVALAKAHPGELVYASAGIGNLTHLAGELFSHTTGIRMVHVPYKGSTPAWIDLLSGHAALMFTSMQGVAPHFKTGRLRLIAVCGEQRKQGFPDTPTLVELGYPGLVMTGWTGYFAPAGAPPEIVKRLSQEIGGIMSRPEMRERMESQGSEAVASTPEEFAAFIKSESAKWRKVIEQAGLLHSQ